jgi:hypothetical protein
MLKVEYVFATKHLELMITPMAPSAQAKRRDRLGHLLEQKVVLHAMDDELVVQSSKSLND